MTNTVKVKICGLTRREDVHAALEAGVDALGFVVGVSPRNLSLEKAKVLIGEVPVSVGRVLVTVRRDLEAVRKDYEESGAGILQIHGLAPREAEQVRKRLSGVQLVGAFHARSTQDVGTLRAISGFFDGLLSDTSTKSTQGGTGVVHDWSLSRSLREAIYPKPLILAGGLTPSNVAQAMRIVQPYAVDVSSGIEASPGVKDQERLRQFVANARGTRAWS